MSNIRTAADLKKWLGEHSEGCIFDRGRTTYYLGDAADYIRVTVNAKEGPWVEVEAFTSGAAVSDVPAIVKAMSSAIGVGCERAPYPLLNREEVIRVCITAAEQAAAEGGQHIACRARELVASSLSDLFQTAAQQWAGQKETNRGEPTTAAPVPCTGKWDCICPEHKDNPPVHPDCTGKGDCTCPWCMEAEAADLAERAGKS